MRTGSKQRGITLSGLIFSSVILVVAGIVGMKMWPAYMQNKAIQTIFVAMAADPSLKKAKPIEVQLAFAKRASIDNITAIKMEELQIERDDAGKLKISANYDVRARLGGNVYLLMEFKPSSAEQ